MQLVLKAETRYYSADTVRLWVALASDRDIVEFVVWCEFSSLPLLFQVIAEISERANCLMIVQKVELSFRSIKAAESFWRFCVVAKLWGRWVAARLRRVLLRCACQWKRVAQSSVSWKEGLLCDPLLALSSSYFPTLEKVLSSSEAWPSCLWHLWQSLMNGILGASMVADILVKSGEKAKLDLQGYEVTATDHFFGPSCPAVTCLGTATSSVTTGEVPNALLVS